MNAVLNVDGMSCERCVQKIKKIVGEIQGVENINVSLDDKSLEVSFNAPCTLNDIKEAVLDCGFEIK